MQDKYMVQAGVSINSGGTDTYSANVQDSCAAGRGRQSTKQSHSGRGRQSTKQSHCSLLPITNRAMRLARFFLVVSVVLTAAALWAVAAHPCFEEGSEPTVSNLTYPYPRREFVIDNYHGTWVMDPYRWMEDPESNETKEFVDAQNVISNAFLNTCPVKEQLTKSITEGKNYPRSGCMERRGLSYYYSHNSGLQNQDVMYVQDSVTDSSSRRVFLDPNLLSADGSTSLTYLHVFSNDGSKFAYGLSEGGTDWTTIKVKEAPSGQDLPDTLTNVKFSLIAWVNNTGFVYSWYPDRDVPVDGKDPSVDDVRKLYYHHLGTDQKDDILVFETPHDSKLISRAESTTDGRYLMVYTYPGIGGETLAVYDLMHGIHGLLNLTPVIDNFDHMYTYVTNMGEEFIFLTNKDAPYYRLIKININRPEIGQWQTLVADDADTGLLDSAIRVNGKLLLHYLHVAKSVMYVHNLETGAREHNVSIEMGSVTCQTAQETDTEAFIGFTSFLYPSRIYRIDMTTFDMEVIQDSKISGFHPENFETKQVFYTSKDGTQVPIFLVHQKNLKLTSDHPVLLYGYGGFRVTLSPMFVTANIVFLQHMGGIFAMPSIRGGSEYGDEWHTAGMLGNKQNVFDDFQAAAEYLISTGYTNKDKIAINGESNGGLLVAACLNQRPDLFGAGIIQVGVLDMLRYQSFTVGFAWVPEYGSSDNATEFQWLYRYSPLHNIPSSPIGGQYPATLLLTADKDDRVVPLHSLKFIAQLQYTLGHNPLQTNPLLIRVDTNTGHGAGKSTIKQIAESVEIMCFMYNTLHLSWTSQ